MLIVLGDVHLTDEWTAINVHASAFARLGDQVVSIATGGRRHADELEFALLGDIFDLVRTDYWFRHGIESGQRPWGCARGSSLNPATGMNPDAASVEAQFRDILADILARPAALALGAMVRDAAERSGIPVRVTYVIGNHDRILWNFESLRAAVAAAFAPVPVEFVACLDREVYGTRARHGHEFDRHCHGWEFLSDVLQPGSCAGRFDAAAYQVMAIGEAVTAELLSALVHGVRARLDPTDAEDWAFLNALAGINNVRPFTSVLHWIGWFAERRKRRYMEIVLESVTTALDGFLASELVRRWDSIHPLELVDGLQLVRTLLRGPDPLETVRRMLDVVHRASAAFNRGDQFREAAEQELEGLPRHIQYILYGHTHVARTDVFHGSHGGAVRMYVNAGAWLPLIERARDGRSYYHTHRMSYALLFAPGEDRTGRMAEGPAMDLWNGLRRRDYPEDELRRA